MSKKELYKQKNKLYLEGLSVEEGTIKLPCGIYCKIITSGSSELSPKTNSVVTVNYKGTLINGKEFDNSWKRGYPEAFRLNEVIEGWQIALQQMHIGDHWIIYIPYELGYGAYSDGTIPGYSTLIFEVELLGIA